MAKRKNFLNVLESVLNYLNTPSVSSVIWAAFTIGFGIMLFVYSKQVPIPLTEKEILYYTSQAEVGYLKGAYYLDENVEFIPVGHSTTFKVHSSLPTGDKQKIRVTFKDGSISKTELYYTFKPFFIRIILIGLGAVIGFAVGFIFWVIIDCLYFQIQRYT